MQKNNQKTRKNKTFTSEMIDFPDYFGLEQRDYMEELAEERMISIDEMILRLKSGRGSISVDY
jgi:hypothetical protein